MNLFCDGGSRGNPGPSAAAAVMIGKNGEILHLDAGYLGEATNNVAEYEGLILGLKLAIKHKFFGDLKVFLDSKLVVNQVKGSFRVNDAKLATLRDEARMLSTSFKSFEITHIPREKNKRADKLVNECLDKAAQAGKNPSQKEERIVPYLGGKIWWVDTETTGLLNVKNDVHQIAGLIEIDGKVVEEFNLRAAPFDFKTVEPEALKVCGITMEQLKGYPNPVETYKQLCGILKKYVDPYNKKDKFTLAGQKYAFDGGFLRSYFNKCGDKYFGSWVHSVSGFDLLNLTFMLRQMGKIKVEDLKLGTICKYLNIELQAHDALSDIKATRECYYELVRRFIK